MWAWLVQSWLRSFGLIILLILLMAFWTSLPWNGLVLSRSSSASWIPVEAPEGTEAVPEAEEVVMVTSIVGWPRLSRIFYFFYLNLFDMRFELKGR